mmetsp:Transcript_2037/g.5968  ORF Transcript_2037/g.5968 Transcript_2037/m.5968 type:complete len:640 (-) Transcript_2037:39-1958(-)
MGCGSSSEVASDPGPPQECKCGRCGGTFHAPAGIHPCPTCGTQNRIQAPSGVPPPPSASIRSTASLGGTKKYQANCGRCSAQFEAPAGTQPCPSCGVLNRITATERADAEQFAVKCGRCGHGWQAQEGTRPCPVCRIPNKVVNPQGPAATKELFTAKCGKCKQGWNAPEGVQPCPHCGTLNNIKASAFKTASWKKRPEAARRAGQRTKALLEEDMNDSKVKYRPPCQYGTKCYRTDGNHIRDFCHPHDEDYCLAVRKHEVKPEFGTIMQCFRFMDPYHKGIVDDMSLLRELLQNLPNGRKGEAEAIWRQIDDDGNGFLSFSEFMEGAEFCGLAGLPVGTDKNLGDFPAACHYKGCKCENFEPNGAVCKCRHSKGYHHVNVHISEMTPVPPYWKNQTLAGDTWEWVDCDQEFVKGVQMAMDASYRPTWTRDRGKGEKVPKGFEVVRVRRNENCKAWRKYAMKRTRIIQKVVDKEGLDAADQFVMMDVKTGNCGVLTFLDDEPLDASCNEWYLWHGTSEAGASGICKDDFKQSKAGTATGTLYGPGTYFAESCTKADEYAKPTQHDPEVFTMLLCRIVAGRVKYTDEDTPDTEKLVESVLHGPYDLVLGDREKCRGTYKEFVVFAGDQAYPEFVVEYRRKW